MRGGRGGRGGRIGLKKGRGRGAGKQGFKDAPPLLPAALAKLLEATAEARAAEQRLAWAEEAVEKAKRRGDQIRRRLERTHGPEEVKAQLARMALAEASSKAAWERIQVAAAPLGSDFCTFTTDGFPEWIEGPRLCVGESELSPAMTALRRGETPIFFGGPLNRWKRYDLAFNAVLEREYMAGHLYIYQAAGSGAVYIFPKGAE